MRIGVHVVSIAHTTHTHTHTLGSTFLLADCDPSATQGGKKKRDEGGPSPKNMDGSSNLICSTNMDLKLSSELSNIRNLIKFLLAIDKKETKFCPSTFFPDETMTG